MAGPLPEPQRAWRAACPNCGAPVEFRSAASASAVCGFCRSTLVREGETLRRTGTSAELFDDHSPLQLGVDGLLQGERFTLIGRLQLAYAEGSWNEWHALFDSGRSGWLSEDNGAYVMSFEAALRGAAPPLAELLPGARASVNGRSWDVASAVRVRLLAAQGELPRSPRVDGREFLVVDLRNPQGEVASLEFGDAGSPPLLSIGRSVALSDLALKGLREDIAKTLAARSLNCPQCGAAVEVRLATTQSLSCAQCHSLIDLSGGGDAAAAFEQQPAQPPGGRVPRIPLGTTGRLAVDGAAPLEWQVVGYLVRTDVPEDDEDEPSPWSEYLLYNRKAGFAFLVDAADGWSVVRPLTGTPEVSGRQAAWQGDRYAQGYTYPAVVTWVEGEFYWRVERGARAVVTDYAGQGKAAKRLLSREAAAGEVTWSAGRRLDAAQIWAAFPGLAGSAARALPPDVGPLSNRSGQDWRQLGIFAVIALVMIVTSIMASCEDDACDDVARHFGNDSNEYRQCMQSRSTGSSRGGGSFGGYSTGGGHK